MNVLLLVLHAEAFNTSVDDCDVSIAPLLDTVCLVRSLQLMRFSHYYGILLLLTVSFHCVCKRERVCIRNVFKVDASKSRYVDNKCLLLHQD